MLRSWTVQRAMSAGIVAGVLALALWPLRESAQWAWAYIATAGATGLCGGSVLAITVSDIYGHPRGRRMRAIRVFDVAIGLLLTLPALDALLGVSWR